MKAVLTPIERCLKAIRPGTSLVPVPYTPSQLTGSLASPSISPIVSRYFIREHLRGRTYHPDLSQRCKVPALVFTDSLRQVGIKRGTFGIPTDVSRLADHQLHIHLQDTLEWRADG